METKKCSRCGEIKPLSEFYKNKRHKDGLHSNCKKCHTSWTTKEQHQAYYRTWAKNHPEAVKKHRADAHNRERFGGQKDYILNRDNFQCQLCGSTADLMVHHKDENNDNHNALNLVTVCKACHMKKHTPWRWKKRKVFCSMKEYKRNWMRKKRASLKI